ncbi:MAG: 50S ribosomal protein L29 [Ignavibacteriales bacterium]|nr:50S ribosomal protein L29 [Ignavibacteriales bacterium]
MKPDALKSLKGLSDAELLKRIQDEEENLAHLRFQKVIGQLENPMRIGHIRKDIARIKTILNDRKKSAAAQPAATEQPKQA